MRSRNGIEYRASLLRDQVLKTWAPPRKSGNETPAEIAQTAVMQTIAFLMGSEFFQDLTENQQLAIDQGLQLMESTLIKTAVVSR